MRKASAERERTPTETPMPMPALAPGERDEGGGVGVGVGVEDDWLFGGIVAVEFGGVLVREATAFECAAAASAAPGTVKVKR